jgi:ubiquinone/menaquinone biosynthesis C-methylase UbiE
MHTFDKYKSDYRNVVQQSIDFAGVQYDFFVAAKARMIKEVAASKWPHRGDLVYLDVGCGVGTLHAHVANAFSRICGIDVSEKSLEAARERNPTCEYRVMEGGTLPYQAATFDLVTAINVLHHVVPADWTEFVLELKRVIRPGGLVTLIEHNPWNPLTRLAVYRCPFDKDAHLLSAARSRRLLKSAGLSNVSSRHFLLTPSSSTPALAIERWVSSVPLGAQYIATGERRAEE